MPFIFEPWTTDHEIKDQVPSHGSHTL